MNSGTCCSGHLTLSSRNFREIVLKSRSPDDKDEIPDQPDKISWSDGNFNHGLSYILGEIQYLTGGKIPVTPLNYLTSHSTPDMYEFFQHLNPDSTRYFAYDALGESTSTIEQTVNRLLGQFRPDSLDLVINRESAISQLYLFLYLGQQLLLSPGGIFLTPIAITSYTAGLNLMLECFDQVEICYPMFAQTGDIWLTGISPRKTADLIFPDNFAGDVIPSSDPEIFPPPLEKVIYRTSQQTDVTFLWGLPGPVDFRVMPKIS